MPPKRKKKQSPQGAKKPHKETVADDDRVKAMAVVSNDGYECIIEDYVIRESGTFRNAYDKGIQRLLLERIDKDTLKHAIIYFTHYRNSKPYNPVIINDKPVRVSNKDPGQQFLFRLKIDLFNKLVETTHLFQSSRLTDGICALLLNKMRHKTTAQIRKLFNLPVVPPGENVDEWYLNMR